MERSLLYGSTHHRSPSRIVDAASVCRAVASMPSASVSAFVHFDSDFLHAMIERAVIRRPYMSLCSDGCGAQFQWCEYESYDWPTALSARGSVVGSLITRRALTRKCQLAMTVNKFVAKRPTSILASAVPETVCFELYDVEYVDECLSDLPEITLMSADERFIIKPNVVNRAAVIAIIDSREAFVKAVTAISDECDALDTPMIREWVCQRYIDRPMISRNRKFHIRTYVLAVGNLAVYVYDRMLALFALEEYSADELTWTRHITNTCRQRDHLGFVESDSVRTLDAVLAVDTWKAAVTQICNITGDVFAAAHNEPTAFQPLSNTFEWFGVDFLMDEQAKVFLLEINAGPDMAQTGDELSGVIECLIEATFQLVIDPQFALNEQRSTNVAETASIVDMNGSEQLAHLRLCYQRIVSSTSLHRMRMT